jgi:hypothetical protein
VVSPDLPSGPDTVKIACAKYQPIRHEEVAAV